MGLSHAVAAAILWTGAAVVALDFVGAGLDQQADLDDAWKGARHAEAERLDTAVSIVSVERQGQTVTLTLSNDGTSTLDAAALTTLIDGVPQDITAYAVEGASRAVWPPSTQATLQYVSNQLPSSVWVATGNGAFAVWRA